jgi:ferredoxin--NADP+ reductase
MRSIRSDAIADAELPGDDEQAIVDLLAGKGIEFTTYADWQLLDRLEQEHGAASGRVRQKFTDVAEMLAAVRTGG